MRRPVVRVRRGRRAMRLPAPSLCAVLLATTLLFGEEPQVSPEGGPTIESLAVDGNQNLSSEAFFRLTTLKVGDPYDEAVLKREFRRLWDRKMFDDLALETRDGEKGKIVIFHVAERPRLNSIEYEKNKVVTETQIEEQLTERNISLRIGSPVDYKAIQDAAEVVRGVLGSKGFLEPTVEAELVPVDAANLALTFKIDPGRKTRLRSLDFEGNTVFTDGQLRGALKLTEEYHWWKMWGWKKALHHPQKLEEDLRQVEAIYKNRGYLDVDLGAPRVTIEEGKPTKNPSKRKRWVRVVVPIVEGVSYRVGKVSVEGNKVFTEPQIRQRIPLVEGQVFDYSLLQAATQKLELDYGERGYYRVSTSRDIKRHDGNIADLHLKIDEDRKFFIDRIEFVGNTTTRDYVLRRELGVGEEELFNLKRFRLGLRKINQLGYFQMTREPEIVPVPGENRVRITVEGQEQSRNEVQVGGGYSGVEGAFFAGSFSTRNFLGRGQVLSAQLQIGGTSNTYALSFQDPWFLGKPWIFGASIFRRDIDYIGSTQKGQGGTVSIGRRLGDFTSLTLTYLIEEVSFKQVGFPESVSTTSSVRPVFSYDTRNNFIRPSAGAQLVASLEFAGGNFLGGDNYFFKPILEGTYYLPSFGRTFVGMHGEIGYVDDFGDRRVPTFERFFLGGERSLRIFSSRSVSPIDDGRYPRAEPRGGRRDRPFVNPLDPQGDEIDELDPLIFIGGNKYLQFNVEYVLPGPGDSPVEVALFLDAGNAWTNKQGYNINDLRMDAGVEVRFYLPIFGAPLRLIYGWNLDPKPYEDDSEFIFSIGTTF